MIEEGACGLLYVVTIPRRSPSHDCDAEQKMIYDWCVENVRSVRWTNVRRGIRVGVKNNKKTYDVLIPDWEEALHFLLRWSS